MAFLESPRLSVLISFGAQGGPAFSTDVVTVRAGYESRNAAWSQARHQFEIGLTVRPQPQFELIRDHFMAVRGRLDGFRFKDHTDYQVSTAEARLIPLHGTNQVGTSGVGYGVPSFQLGKYYAAGANSYIRDIRKPVIGTLSVRRNGSNVTAGVGAGNYAIDTTTGVVTFVADQSRSITSHTPAVGHLLVVASAFSPNLTSADRVYITGVSGTAATLLNGLSHDISAVASANITITTNTSGLTASGGTAYFYPQAIDTVDFAVEFDVPVRFDIDHFNATIVNRAGSGGELLIELTSVPLIEIRV